MSLKRRSFSAAFKLRVVREIEAGKSVAQAAREHQLHPNLIRTWRKRYGERSFAARLTRSILGHAPEVLRRNTRGNAAAVFEAEAGGIAVVLKLYAPEQRAVGFAPIVGAMQRAREAGVPVPRILAHGHGAPYAYLAYERVPGVPADAYDGDPRPVWKQVGRHVAGVNALAAAGYGRLDQPALSPAWSAYISPTVDRLLAACADLTEVFDDRLRTALADRLYRLARWDFTPALVHGNVTHGNVIVDPDTGTVQALIDWDGALHARAPHFELATALLWLEADAQEAFLDGYGLTRSALAEIEQEVETARLFYLARYLPWHCATGNEGLVRAVLMEMQRILG